MGSVDKLVPPSFLYAMYVGITCIGIIPAVISVGDIIFKRGIAIPKNNDVAKRNIFFFCAATEYEGENEEERG